MLNGYYDTENEKDLEKYSKEIWNILQNSYKNIGGFLTYNTINDMLRNTSMASMYFCNDSMLSCAIYKNVLGGEKMVGCGTLNGKKDEKITLYNIIKNDINEFSNWHWAEVSGGVEKLFKKYNGNPIPNVLASTILKRPKMEIVLDSDGVHYKRIIGDAERTKIIYGFNAKETYNKVIDEIYQLTGFESYESFKNAKNDLPTICESYDYLKNSKNPNKSFSMEVLIQLDYIYRDYNIREVPRELYKCFETSIKYLKDFVDLDFKIKLIVENATYLLSNMIILQKRSFSSIEKYLFSPC